MKTKLVAIALILLISISCADKKVTVVDDKTQVNLSGRWNDNDSKAVAEEMVKDGLERPWIKEYSDEAKKKPAIVVGIVKNKTAEHINPETFINDIEREFINSGKVKIVAGSDAREELRKERGAGQDFASPESTKKWGKELGADFLMQGTLNSIEDSNSKEKVIYYQIDLSLTNLETNEKVWIGSKKIKKIIK